MAGYARALWPRSPPCKRGADMTPIRMVPAPPVPCVGGAGPRRRVLRSAALGPNRRRGLRRGQRQPHRGVEPGPAERHPLGRQRRGHALVRQRGQLRRRFPQSAVGHGLPGHLPRLRAYRRPGLRHQRRRRTDIEGPNGATTTGTAAPAGPAYQITEASFTATATPSPTCTSTSTAAGRAARKGSDCSRRFPQRLMSKASFCEPHSFVMSGCSTSM